MPLRSGILAFDRYKVLAIEDLTDPQRQALLKQAVNNWRGA